MTAAVSVNRVESVVSPPVGQENYVLVQRFFTNLPDGERAVRVAIELLLETTTHVWWATVQDLGVGAAGTSPADAALTAMRAAVALM